MHKFLNSQISVPGKAAALLLHEAVLLTKNIMSEDKDTLFPDQAMLWNCPGCAPPKFDLPPPPRPPWMEEVEDCASKVWDTDHVTLSEYLASMETCDNTLIRDSQSYFEDTFHSIAIIVVCSLILVIMILGFGLYFFKRRKSMPSSYGSDYNPNRGNATLPGGPNAHHQVPKRFVGNVNPAIDCSTPTHLSHTLGPIKPRQVLYEGQAVTSLLSNGHTMTRCLANHYIPDRMLTLDTRLHHHSSSGPAPFDQHSMTLVPTEHHQGSAILGNGSSRQFVQDEFRQRFAPEVRRNVMELSERPPMPVPSSVYQMSDYPHIVIGGKPFFLIPSSNTSSIVPDLDPSTTTGCSSSEAYAYPQHMPIYEEIDYNAVNCSTNSEAIIFNTSSNNSNKNVVMDRPLSSTASQSNSAHTNTSELSSNESNSSQNENHPNNSNHIHHQGFHGSNIPQLSNSTRKKRLATVVAASTEDQIQLSRSPQSMHSTAKINSSNKSINTSSGSANSSTTGGNQSVYYYSDTLKQPRNTYANTSMDMSDDSIEVVTKKVNTKVTLEDPTQSGSTLV